MASAQSASEVSRTDPPARSSKRPEKRFQFIDNSNNASMVNNSTQVRRHVMQEYMREKRWEARSKTEASSDADGTSRRRSQKSRGQNAAAHKRKSKQSSGTVASKSQWPKHLLPASNEPQILAVGESNIEEIVRDHTVPTKASPLLFLHSDAFEKLADAPYSKSSSSSTVESGDSLSPISWPCNPKQSPEPFTMLSAARTDPFDCLPMRLGLQEQELFDFYATVMPACSYGFERRSPHAHNWYLSVFIPEAMKGAVCFQNTILVHAANTQAWVQGLAETPLAIEHRAKASQLLLHHYQRFPQDTSDVTISATISAAALEDFHPNIERRKWAWLHWEAVVQKIRNRGGPAALAQHNRLQMLINWSDYIFSGYQGHGATFYFNHELSPSHSNDGEAEAIARAEIAQQCSELVNFLKCSEQLAFVHAAIQNNPSAHNQQPMRFSVFSPGQPLYNLLASSNGPRYTETGQFKQIISRLAALITINTALLEYQASANLSEEFLAELLQNLLYNDLDRHISVEALIQILLSGSEKPRLLQTDRPWFVGRMVKVAKRLTRPTFEKLNSLLLQFLTLAPDLQPAILEWESDLRAEILGAPLRSYVSRFMMEDPYKAQVL